MADNTPRLRRSIRILSHDHSTLAQDIIAQYFEGSKDEQRKIIEKLMSIMRRFSEREASTEDEQFRWMQACFDAAMVAHEFGMMDNPKKSSRAVNLR